MRSSDQPSLWESTTAAAGLAGRFLQDAAITFPLEILAEASLLDEHRHELEGATVAVRTDTQLTTALILLELDGVAGRIVLCTPDVSTEQLRAAVTVAGVTALISERPLPELSHAGVACITCSSRHITPLQSPRPSGRQTEWALFTSGTAGTPKIVVHRLHTLIGAIRPGEAAGRIFGTFYDIRRYGGLQILLRALMGGGSMVLSGLNEPIGDFLRRIDRAAVTFLSGTPTHWRRALLSEAAVAFAPTDVRLSGEAADQAILDKLRATYPAARVCHAFASTEAGVAFEVTDGLAGFPAEWIGQVRAGVELRVTNDTLEIRSPRTAERYVGSNVGPFKNVEGYVDTKDLVERQGGRYYFKGRRDGVINVGGLKVHPEEVETIVNRHPCVEMSQVRAKRNPFIGEVVVVDVVLSPRAPYRRGSQALELEILDACRQFLPSYKVPATVRVVPSLAVSPAGKLIRARG